MDNIQTKKAIVLAHLSQNPGIGNKALAEKLRAEGHDIDPDYIAQVKSNQKKRLETSNTPIFDVASIRQVMVVKAKVDALGGVEKVTCAVETVKTLLETVGSLETLELILQAVRELAEIAVDPISDK